MELKRIKYFLCFALIAIVVSTIFMVNRHSALTTLDVPQETLNQQYLKSFLQIKGFKFNSHKNGEKILSLKADDLTIEKKKLGFFRIGLINVAIIKNAVIDIYFGKKIFNTGMDSVGETFLPLKSAFPSFSKKRIFSIIIEPVCLNLKDKKSTLTKITSNSAIIKLTKQSILFKGNVRVVSGDKTLITERLKLFTENSVMKIDRHFMLKSSKKTIEGHNIIVDIFLNIKEDKVDRKPDVPKGSSL